MNRPLYSTDIILFSMIKGDLKVLLIKRAKGERESEKWALPGGIVDYTKKETSLIKAMKLLENRLGVKDNVYLERCDIYDDINRDPDKYSISVSYLALIDEVSTKIVIGEGVSDFKWVNVEELPTLAFDHAKMVKDASNKLRSNLRRSNLGFKFLPKEFTIPQVRKIYEDILGITINASNFRTKLLKMNVLNSCNKKSRIVDNKPVQGQPPKLYVLKEDALKRILSTEQLFNK
jgi:ADP-ribose pyrophosphatase YjhB (NUDIX family)